MHHRTHLGQVSSLPAAHAPDVLRPIPRTLARAQLQGHSPVPMHGIDVWTAYELSWLDLDGRPRIGVASLVLDAQTPCLIESKSLKLYLGSLNETRLAGPEAVVALISPHLERAAGGPVAVQWHDPAALALQHAPGSSIDGAPWRAPTQPLDAQALRAAGPRVHEVLHSELLRSLCPVTAQPDWATVVLDYVGPRIDASGLLTYVASMRQHQGFHEQCVEQMFTHIAERCAPERLTLWARFTRRGGLDINPLRSSVPDCAGPAAMSRLWRQ